MNNIYVIVKKGIYIRDICGVYVNSHYACEQAEELAYEEPDSWHEFAVHKLDTNKRVELCGTNLIGSWRKSGKVKRMEVRLRGGDHLEKGSDVSG
jgi:hypothetical protein